MSFNSQKYLFIIIIHHVYSKTKNIVLITLHFSIYTSNNDASAFRTRRWVALTFRARHRFYIISDWLWSCILLSNWPISPLRVKKHCSGVGVCSVLDFLQLSLATLYSHILSETVESLYIKVFLVKPC